MPLLPHLPAQSLPREKLLTRGASALSDIELLAIVLRTGLAGCGVLQLAEQLLATQGGLAGLLHTSVADLGRTKGLGPAKTAELLAVMELAKRAVAQQLQARAVFDSPATVQQYVQLHIGQRPHEIFAVLFLDSQHRLIAMEELFRGTLTHTAVYPREVVVRALHHHAHAVVLAHNHPSGSVQPSAANLALTRTLQSAHTLVDVRVLDHIIVGPGAGYSMAQEGQL